MVLSAVDNGAEITQQVLSNRRSTPGLASLLEQYAPEGLRHACYPAPEHFDARLSPARWAHALRARSEARRPRPLALFVQFPVAGDDRAVGALERHLDQIGALLGRREEIVRLHVAGVGSAVLADDALERLRARIESAFAFARGAERSIELAARDATEENQRALRRLGFDRLVLRARGRARSADQAGEPLLTQALEAAQAAGFDAVGVELLYGAPGQAPNDLAAALERVVALRPAHVNLNAYGARPLPPRVAGDPLPAAPDARVRAEILARAIERLLDAEYAHAGLDVFVREPNGAPRHCSLGYPVPSRYDVIGIGPGAISSIGDLYAENQPSVESYAARLAQGEMPVQRGLQLSSDDLLRREIIHALECHFAVAFSALEHKYGIEFARYFARELDDLDRLENDGLVELYEDAIEVPEPGRPLVCVASAVFDRHRPQARRPARASGP